MTLYKDFLTGDKMFSDALPIKKVNDYIWEVEGNDTRVKEADPSAVDAEEAGENNVVDIVYLFGLESMMPGTLKDYQAYLEKYLGKVNERIDKKYPAKKADFQNTVMDYFKRNIFEKFKDWAFYRTPSRNFPNQYLIPSNVREDGVTQYFVFITEGLDEETM
ncbi:hypothetical protein Aperf_G00000005481 [Anoplocephala perfoliata]